MTDARRYAVSDRRSRSRALQGWKYFHFQTLSPQPFTMGAGNWPLILKLGHNIHIWLGQIIYICPSFCVTWLWTWQKRQLQRVDRQFRIGLIFVYFQFVFCLLAWLPVSCIAACDMHPIAASYSTQSYTVVAAVYWSFAVKCWIDTV